MGSAWGGAARGVMLGCLTGLGCFLDRVRSGIVMGPPKALDATTLTGMEGPLVVEAMTLTEEELRAGRFRPDVAGRVTLESVILRRIQIWRREKCVSI